VDAGVHHLQAEAERVKPADVLSILREFHREKLTLRQRHVAVACHVSHYAFNNTYQYVIAREDVHLSWLEAAIAELGGTPETVGDVTLAAPGKGTNFVPMVQEDARDAAAFVSRWRQRLSEITNARHRTMMNVILGETLEHKRFFDQMVAGNEELLGRRMAGAGTGNGVLPVRWLE
jgi:hypothetical protein